MDVGLSFKENQEIVRLLRRHPNQLELGLFGALWSEHCSYKSSKPLLARLPHEGRFVVQGPGGNAGVVQLSSRWDLAFKIESHNHPSYVEPEQGAATGVGGILRDIVAMGARPIALADILKFGTDDKSQTLRRGIVEGIGDYGNAIGIPTVTGTVGYSEVYDANPLVNVLAVGLRARNVHVGADGARPGSVLILMGQATGRDGIHGASLLASQDFGEQTEEMRPTVQVGDPFMGKLLMEATLAIVGKGLADAVQDLGAAGLTSSTAELAYASQVGLIVDVSQVMCREPEMSAYEIMLSETQERMLVSIPLDKLKETLDLISDYELPYTEIGRVVEGDFLRIVKGDVVLADVPTGVLVGGCPRLPVPSDLSTLLGEELLEEETSIPLNPEWGYQVLGHPDCRERSAIYRRYDSTIGVRTVWGPDHDVAVLRIDDTDGVAIAVCAPARWAAVDSTAGGIGAVVNALSLVATQGAEPLGLTDGINAGNPDKPQAYRRMAGLIEGIAQAARVLEVPVTGGNVSLHNETRGQAIWPTAAIGVVARHPHPLSPVLDQVARPNLRICLLNPPKVSRLGGSVLQEILGSTGSYPRLDLAGIKSSLHVLMDMAPKADQAGLAAVRSVGLGGTFVAIARSLMTPSRNVGVQLNLPADSLVLDLFNEMAGQWILYIEPDFLSRWEDACQARGVRLQNIGITTDSPDIVIKGGRTVTWPLQELWHAYRQGGDFIGR